jgi:hypothetical protein
MEMGNRTSAGSAKVLSQITRHGDILSERGTSRIARAAGLGQAASVNSTSKHRKFCTW